MILKLKQISQNKSHLIFDFDKTIAQMEIDWSDWHSGISDIYKKYDSAHGYEKGKNPHEYYNILAAKHGNKLIGDVRKFVADYEQKNTISFTPYSELVDFIKNNSSSKMYIFSSNARSTVELGLEKLNIIDLFEKIISRDDVSLLKPSVEGFYLLDDFEELKDDYLMIGDSEADEVAASLAGIDFLKCTYFGTYHFPNKKL